MSNTEPAPAARGARSRGSSKPVLAKSRLSPKCDDPRTDSGQRLAGRLPVGWKSWSVVEGIAGRRIGTHESAHLSAPEVESQEGPPIESLA